LPPLMGHGAGAVPAFRAGLPLRWLGQPVGGPSRASPRRTRAGRAASAVDRFVDRVSAKPQRHECYLCDSSRHRCSQRVRSRGSGPS